MILDMDTIQKLRSLEATGALAVDPDDPDLADLQHAEEDRLTRQFQSLAEQVGAPGVALADLHIGGWVEGVLPGAVFCTVRWAPKSNQVRLVGGPAHGMLTEVEYAERPLTIRVQLPDLIDDRLAGEEPDLQLVATEDVVYTVEGWDTDTGTWVYTLQP